MNYYETLEAKKRWLEEAREKKEREPYEEIIRRLRKHDREKARLRQYPSDGKS